MKNAFFILLLLLPLSAKGKIIAVLVGVSEYEQSINNLHYCHSDAVEMYKLLIDYTAPENMVLLTNQHAKRDNIVYYLTQLFQQAQPDDMVFFFFSGHGNKDVFMTYDSVLYFSTLEQIFKKTKAKRKLIFADACFSGTLRQQGSPETPNNSNAGTNVLLFLSSRSDQFSQEDLSLKNGAFTYFLLAGLRGGADTDKDGNITARELFNFVYPKVKERTNGRQIPVMWGKFDENMIILKLKNK